MRSETGSALIEALVSLLVLALGLLAMARLQAGNLAESRHTNARATAVQLASDLKERMLANGAAMTVNQSLNPYIVGFGSVSGNDDCQTAGCTPQAMAAWDLVQWKAQLATQLPDGDAQVFIDSNIPGQFGVLVAWRAIQSHHQGNAAPGDAKTQEQYRQANTVWQDLETEGTAVKSVSCPSDRLCHLIYMRP